MFVHKWSLYISFMHLFVTQPLYGHVHHIYTIVSRRWLNLPSQVQSLTKN